MMMLSGNPDHREESQVSSWLPEFLPLNRQEFAEFTAKGKFFIP
jgi:hypothetical protein